MRQAPRHPVHLTADVPADMMSMPGDPRMDPMMMDPSCMSPSRLPPSSVRFVIRTVNRLYLMVHARQFGILRHATPDRVCSLVQ